MAINPISGIAEVIMSILKSVSWLWLLVGAALGWFLLPKVLG